MNVYSFIMISDLNGHKVAEYLIYSIIVTLSWFFEGTIDEGAFFHQNILEQWVQSSRLTVPFNYCDFEPVLLKESWLNVCSFIMISELNGYKVYDSFNYCNLEPVF